MCEYMHECTYACTRVCTHMSTPVCICTQVHPCMCTHVYASMHKHMQDTYTCMHMCTSAHMQAHECARLCMSACLQAHTHAQPLAGMPSSPADALPGKFQAVLALPMVLRARVQAGLREKLQAWLCSKVSLSPGWPAGSPRRTRRGRPAALSFAQPWRVLGSRGHTGSWLLPSLPVGPGSPQHPLLLVWPRQAQPCPPTHPLRGDPLRGPCLAGSVGPCTQVLPSWFRPPPPWGAFPPGFHQGTLRPSPPLLPLAVLGALPFPSGPLRVGVPRLSPWCPTSHGGLSQAQGCAVHCEPCVQPGSPSWTPEACNQPAQQHLLGGSGTQASERDRAPGPPSLLPTAAPPLPIACGGCILPALGGCQLCLLPPCLDTGDLPAAPLLPAVPLLHLPSSGLDG